MALICFFFVGDEHLQAPQVVAGTIVRSQLSIILEPDDNLAVYECRASNDATAAPLVAKVTLQVNCKSMFLAQKYPPIKDLETDKRKLFLQIVPPTSLEISTDPPQISAGEPVTITCKSSSSNPPSTITWLRGGRRIQGRDGGQVDAGWISRP